MAEPKLELLSKFTLGGQELRNRLVMAPMTRARGTFHGDFSATETTIPNELQALYYEQRAASPGFIITEAAAVAGPGWPLAPQLRTKEQMEGWKMVVDRVHAKQGIIYVQLWHAAHLTEPAAGVEKEGDATASQTVTVEDLQQAIQDFVNGAQLAKEAGFDGIEIHADGGYLIDQLLQSATNHRNDEYGGSMENRVRFLKQVLAAVIADGAFSPNRIGVRFSPNGNHGGMGSDDNDVMFRFVAKEMNQYGLAYLHIMDGLGFGFHNKCPVVRVSDIKRNFDGPVIANVGLTKEIAEGMIRSGAADLACFGRKYISNPDLAERFAHNWPLNDEPPWETWWQPIGATGYTDWPFYQEEGQDVEPKKWPFVNEEDEEEKKDDEFIRSNID